MYVFRFCFISLIVNTDIKNEELLLKALKRLKKILAQGQIQKLYINITNLVGSIVGIVSGHMVIEGLFCNV